MTVALKFQHVEVVSSTNDIALELARRGEPEGLVITADQQISGRGRRGRTWQDQPGQCVLMSLLLRPRVPASDLPILSYAISLGVAEWLSEKRGLQAQVKWPNDVLVHTRKIAGILVELGSSAQEQVAVVGIGVNVNQREFPNELTDLATSIAIETGCNQVVPEMAKSLASHLILLYDRFCSAGAKEIIGQWRNYMWGIGQSVDIVTESGTLTGEIRGVDDAGALLIADAAGVVHSIHAADTIKTTRN